MVQLLQIYEGPQRIMRKRDKRLPEYARYKAINDRGDKPDKKTTEQGEQFVALNETLKDELPKLYALTSKLMEACLKNFIQIQTTWFGVLQKKIGAHVEAFPSDLHKLITDFHSDHTLMEARMSELSSCNGSMLTSSLNLVPMSPSNETGITSPRRPSTINSSTRPGSMTEDSPKVSRDFSIGSHPFQSPQTEGQSVRSGRYRADSTLSGRVVSDGPSKLLQQVTGSSTPARTSRNRALPKLASAQPGHTFPGRCHQQHTLNRCSVFSCRPLLWIFFVRYAHVRYAQRAPSGSDQPRLLRSARSSLLRSQPLQF